MINIIHQLRMAKGNKKQRVLEDYADNQHWRQYLQATYDTSINYGVSAPKDATFREPGNPVILFHDLERTRVHPAGSSKQRFALEMSKKHGELYRLALGGSIRAGVSTTTLNKIMPGLIPTFEVMLAKDIDSVKYPIWGSTKFDGVRLIAIVRDASVTLYTRSGKILNLKELEETMSSAPRGVYDGELVSGDGRQAGRTSITGSVNKVLKGSTNHIEDYTFCVFDCLTLQEWNAQECHAIYRQRYESLDIINLLPRVQRVEQVRLHSAEETQQMYAEHLLKGYEGLILRYPEDMYEWKRTPKLIKMKPTYDCELQCLSVIEGKGKYEGMIGALRCAGMVADKEVVVNVGSGFSDWDRAKTAFDYVGHNIEVMYNDVVRSVGADHHSLFLPRFKRVKGSV